MALADGGTASGEGPSSPIHLIVHSLGGEPSELEVDPSINLMELKEKVAEQQGLPPSFLELAIGDKILEGLNCEIFRGQPPRAMPLEVTAVVSLAPLLDVRLSKRCVALEELGRVGKQNNQRAIAALSRFVDDDDGEVRVAALRALGDVCGPGCKEGIDAAFRRLEDRPVEALEVLARVCQNGDPRAVAAACGLLRDSASGFTKAAAARALGRLAEHGDGEALAALQPLVEAGDAHWLAEAREAARQAVESITGKPLEPSSGRRLRKRPSPSVASPSAKAKSD